MFQGRYIPNFIELAQLEMLKKIGGAKSLKKEKETFPISKSADFRVP